MSKDKHRNRTTRERGHEPMAMSEHLQKQPSGNSVRNRKKDRKRKEERERKKEQKLIKLVEIDEQSE